MNNNEDIFKGLGVEVKLVNDKQGDQEAPFLKVVETLTRIGLTAKSENRLFQTAHILHKQGRYAIVHFKEMFQMDGKKADISEEDILRRNTIVDLLRQWKLVEIIDNKSIKHKLNISSLKIVKYSEKNDWILTPKYTLGNKK